MLHSDLLCSVRRRIFTTSFETNSVTVAILRGNSISFSAVCLEKLSAVKFAAYRVACKLRVLQKHLKCKTIGVRRPGMNVSLLVTFVDYNILVRVFNTHQLPFGVETEQISIDDARKVLVAIYQLISVYHFNESTIEETVETFLRFLGDILQG